MRLSGWAGLGTLSIIMLLQLRGMDTPLRSPETPLGVVGYELAFTPARAEAMLSTWRSLDRIEALRVSLGFDVVFLLVYPWFLRRSIHVTRAWRTPPDEASRWTRIGSVLATAVLACIPLDALENALLWQMITQQPTAVRTVTAGVAATIKFALVFAALAWCVGTLMTRWRTNPQGRAS